MPRKPTDHSKHPLPTTQEKTTHGHHVMVNTEIRLIIFSAAKDGEALYSQQNNLKCSTWMQSQKLQNDLCFQGKPFNIRVIQVYAPISNAEEAEVEQFYEDLQHLVELTLKKGVLFIIGDWNAKVGSQETHGVTGKFGLGIRNEAGQRLIEFCQENALVIVNTLFQQHKRRLYTWTSPDGQHRNQIDYIFCSQRWRSSIQSAKTRPGADWLRS